jgi:hypothetical protein
VPKRVLLRGGVTDPVSTVVHQADTRNVDTVLVGGPVLKRGVKLVGADLRAARDRAASSLDYLLGRTTVQRHRVQSAGDMQNDSGPVHAH